MRDLVDELLHAQVSERLFGAKRMPALGRLVLEGLYEDGVVDLKKALELAKSSALAHNMVGDTYGRARRWKAPMPP